METMDLKSLVAKAAAGNVDAYGQLVRRFQDMAFGYAYSILDDFHTAQDASQEAFLEAYRQLGRLKEPIAFPNWFRRIVFSQCTAITRRKEKAMVPLEAAGGKPVGWAFRSSFPKPTILARQAKHLRPFQNKK